MTFKFYNYAGAALNVNKAPLLDNPLTISDGHISGNQDIEAPTLIISTTGAHAAAGYNYVYIQDWSRYYFVVKRVWLADGALMITLREDYIYTANALILAQTGYCRFSGLGDGNIVDNRASLKPAATVKRYRAESTSGNYTRNVYALKFYSSNPIIASEVPQPPPPVLGLVQNIVFLSKESLATFLHNYESLSETERVAVGKAIVSINYIPRPGYITSPAVDVTKLKFATPFSASPIEVSCQYSSPALHYAKMIASPEDVTTAIQPESYHIIGNTPGTPYSFNSSDRFYLLNGTFTLRMPGMQPIDIKPSTYGLSGSFNITFNISYEPYTEQHIINLFPDILDGKYTPILQKCALSMPFMSDTSFDQFNLTTISQAINMVSGLTGGLARIGASAAGGDISGLIQTGSGMASSFTNFISQQQRMELAEQTGYSVSGSPGIGLFFASGINTSNVPYLYHTYYEPVMLPWNYKGVPDYTWRSLLTLAGTGYAEIDLVDIVGNSYNYTDSELQQIKTALSSGVIFNGTP